MATWVLILIMTGRGIATVPGYLTEAECNSAARAFANKSAVLQTRDAQCIPGPTK